MSAERASAFPKSSNARVSDCQSAVGCDPRFGAGGESLKHLLCGSAPFGEQTGLVGETDDEDAIALCDALIDKRERRRAHRFEGRVHARRTVDRDADLERIGGAADDPQDLLRLALPENLELFGARRRGAAREGHPHEAGAHVDPLAELLRRRGLLAQDARREREAAKTEDPSPADLPGSDRHALRCLQSLCRTPEARTGSSRLRPAAPDYGATRLRSNSRNFVQVLPSVDISPISYQRSATVQSTT